MPPPPTALAESAPAHIPTWSHGQPRTSALASHWRLDPGLTFLNHGSFGATPTVVRRAQEIARDTMERDPIAYFVVELPNMLDTTRRKIAELVNCDWTDLALLPNATWAMSTILHNYDLKPGDEILANDHEYPACMNQLRFVAEKAGAKVVMASVPFPVASPEQIEAAILSKVTPRTRLVLLSHISSPTALVFPVERIVAELNRRGIDSIVDAAHSAGSVAIDVRAIQPTYLFSNAHKWLCSPKGSAFLYVRPDKQKGFRPLALSVSAHMERDDRAKFLWEFDYIGGNDYSAHAAVPTGIDFLSGISQGGIPGVCRRNHDLIVQARRVICNALGTTPASPDSMLASMATILLPDPSPAAAARKSKYRDGLQDALVDKHRIQVPIWILPETNRRAVRISAQLYNTLEQYEYLAWALKTELDAEKRLG